MMARRCRRRKGQSAPSAASPAAAAAAAAAAAHLAVAADRRAAARAAVRGGAVAAAGWGGATGGRPPGDIANVPAPVPEALSGNPKPATAEQRAHPAARHRAAELYAQLGRTPWFRRSRRWWRVTGGYKRDAELAADSCGRLSASRFGVGNDHRVGAQLGAMMDQALARRAAMLAAAGAGGDVGIGGGGGRRPVPQSPPSPACSAQANAGRILNRRRWTRDDP